jgi:hypothetical protein
MTEDPGPDFRLTRPFRVMAVGVPGSEHDMPQKILAVGT